MTVYVALGTGKKHETVNLLACPDANDLTTGKNVIAKVECKRVNIGDIVEVADLPFDRESFYSYVMNIKLKVVRVVEAE